MVAKGADRESLFGQDPGSELLTGSIEHITWQAEDSDFIILRIRPEGQSYDITAKGPLPYAEVGEFVTLSGLWHRDPRYGPQFRFKAARATAPQSREGLIKYLSSKLVDGIGATFAIRLVDAFGVDLLRVVEEEPEKLRTVKGVGAKRQKQIIDSLRAQRERRDGLVALYSLGLNEGQASELLKRYGEQAAALVRAQPYRLAREIRGIGFLTADRIAARAGISKDSVERARAGLDHILREMAQDGDTVVHEDDLLAGSAKLLERPAAELAPVLLAARQADEIERFESDGEGYCGLPEILHAERLIARTLTELRQAGRERIPEIDAPRALSWVKDRVGLELTETQQQAVCLALEEPVAVLTGGPGVGKTTVLRSLVEILEAKGVAFALAAPTGRAAKRLEEATGRPAQTLHRMLEFTPGTARFRRGRQQPLEADAIIVDESSMLDVHLTSRLVQAVPLGGSLLFVGDKDQLPSIGPGAVLRDFLESRVIPAIELKTVFRQAESSAIVRNAHRVNRGELPELSDARERSDASLGDFFFVARKDAASTVDTIEQLVAERIPKAFGLDPVKDVQVLTPMHRGQAGTQNLNARLQARLRPAQEEAATLSKGNLSFRSGDKVMQLKNDYDREVFNGDMGIIAQVEVEARRLTVDFPDKQVIYESKDLAGLTLAYAASIHKSQGSEFPAVVIPWLNEHFVMLKRNLLYTAMTRARRLVIIVGQKRAVEQAVADDQMHHRRTTLGVRLVEAARAEGAAGSW